MPFSRVCSLTQVLGNIIGSFSGVTAAGTYTHREDIQTQQREAEGFSSTLLCVILRASLFPSSLPIPERRRA